MIRGGPFYAASKRAFDVVAASAGLVVLSPFMAAIAVAIKVDSPGPVLFRQVRVGRGGHRIHVWKYRTMIDGAEALSRETEGVDDPRITRLGKYLRHYKIDEIPQLFNVVWGDMSLVGPRPEIPYYADRYDGSDRVVLEVKPGVTDPSSIELSRLDYIMAGRGDETAQAFYTRVIQPRKLELQKDYLAHRTFSGDISLLLRTVGRIFSR